MSEFTIHLSPDPFAKPEPFAKLPALAERLGVKEGSSGKNPDTYFQLTDGRRYSVFDLVNAMLDRIDTATK